MTKQVDPKDIHFWEDEKILVDANIWLYVFGPESVNSPDKYSNMFYRMLDNNAKLYLNFSIISEFINRSVRLSYAAYINQHGHRRENFDYKRDYRPTQHFKEHYHQAVANIKDILKFACIIQTDTSNIVKSIANLTMQDFNDEIIIQDGILNNFSIFTADKDYLDYNNDELRVISL